MNTDTPASTTTTPAATTTATTTAVPPSTMRAITQSRYGTADVLRAAHVPRPMVGDGQVLGELQGQCLGM